MEDTDKSNTVKNVLFNLKQVIRLAKNQINKFWVNHFFK